MTDAVQITRTVDTDLAADDLWQLVADSDQWTQWLVEEAHIDVAPHAEGTVVDDGETRRVRIDRVEPGNQSLGFTWWPTDAPQLASAVDIVVLPHPAGSTLHVTETLPSAAASATTGAAAAFTWDVRCVLLGCRGLVMSTRPFAGLQFAARA